MLVACFVDFGWLGSRLFGKELFVLFAAGAFRELSSIYVFSYFPFGFEGRIWDLIVSVPDHCLSFYFINICIGNGSLKCHRVLISTTPSFGDKVICWYTGFTFKTLYSNINLLSFLLFLRDSHFNCPRMPVILPVS